MERIQAALERARALREGRTPPVVEMPVAAAEASGAEPEPLMLTPHDAAEAKIRAVPREPAPEVKPRRRRALRTPRFHEPAEDETAAAVEAPDMPGSEASALTAPVPQFSPGKLPVTADTALWQRLRLFNPDTRRLKRARIVTVARHDTAHETFDVIRTRLLQTIAREGWRRVAITAPSRGCGKTTMALNLGFSLARRQDVRTVLMDLDLRQPGVGKLLGLKPGASMARVLDGSGTIEENFVRFGETLAIGPTSGAIKNPSELLQNTRADEAMGEVLSRLGPHVLLYDMPPMDAGDDVMAFLGQIDCVLIVAGAEKTTIDEIDRAERELGQQTNVLGVVLNKCRFADQKFGT